MELHEWCGPVLLVEDNDDLAYAESEILLRAGMSVRTAKTLAEALGFAASDQDSPPECILLDLGLPDVTREEAESGVSIMSIRGVNKAAALVVITGGPTRLPSMVESHYVQAWVTKTESPKNLPWVVRCAVAFMAGAHAGIAATASAMTEGQTP